MTNTTRCKYIAIGANIFVILLSLSILASLYLFSVENGNPKSESNSRTLRQQGEDTEQEREREVSKKLFAYLPALLQDFINWLGQSVSSSSEEPTTSLFTAGRPLIAAAFLSYLLAIVGSIAIGLEHVTLLIILIVIFAFIFASSLSALVFSLLSALLENSIVLLDFWNCLLIAIICISALQIYTTVYLVYEIYMERRVERSHEYCLAKMVPGIEEL